MREETSSLRVFFPQEERVTTDEDLQNLKSVFLHSNVSDEIIAQMDPRALREIFFLSGGVVERVQRANAATQRILLKRCGNIRGHLCILLQKLLSKQDEMYPCLNDTNEKERLLRYKRNMLKVIWAMGKDQQTREVPPYLD